MAFTTFPSIAQDQTNPPPMLRVIREDIKPGRGAAHERIEAGYVRAFAKSKYPNYLAMTSLTGPDQAWFLEPYATYAALESSLQLVDHDAVLKKQLDQLDSQDGDMRSGGRNMILVYQKDLSYRAEDLIRDIPKAHYMRIQTIRIKSGHGTEFAEVRKTLNAALAKMNVAAPAAVYTVASGAPAGTYIILRPADSLKALDPGPPAAMTIQQAMGGDAAFASYRKSNNDLVVSSENTLFSFNPKMSYPPKRFVDADPDFWTPKASATPAKTAAKPAGSK
ncbi:MAG: hypothetical protein M3O35_03590 [Acidobacteriota bacterium]|nr:hypothetical protein [Acidobacteriota bacterium]